MAKWIRLLSRPAGSSGHWHVLASDKEFTTADALCGERFPGAVEATSSEDKLVREGRCPTCAAALAAKQKKTYSGVAQVSR